MSDVVVFGGTTEGRKLAEYCSRAQIPTVVCVATTQGVESSPHAAGVTVHVGRMEIGEIVEFLNRIQPKVVVDATHPYATDITANVIAATETLGIPLIRVARSATSLDTDDGIHHFADLDALINWVNTTQGIVFSTMGVKEAQALTRVENYAERVYLRVLPVAEGIAQCATLGYPTAHLVAMQGPFSVETNAAMFRQTGAAILITKDSGAAGGLPEKLRAAMACGMTVAIVDRPGGYPGVPLEEAYRLVSQEVQ